VVREAVGARFQIPVGDLFAATTTANARGRVSACFSKSRCRTLPEARHPVFRLSPVFGAEVEPFLWT